MENGMLYGMDKWVIHCGKILKILTNKGKRMNYNNERKVKEENDNATENKMPATDFIDPVDVILLIDYT